MLKRFAAIAGAAGLMLASGTASAAFEPFCVNSLSIPGTVATGDYTTRINSPTLGCSAADSPTPRGFVANNLNGKYTEILAVAPTLDPNVFAFQSTVVATWGQFAIGGIGLSANSTLLGRDYGLYAIVEATGTLAGGQFSATNATIKLFADPFANSGSTTTQELDANLEAVWNGFAPEFNGSNADDIEILSATFNGGFGSATAPGRFTFTFKNNQLTPEGQALFIAPRPFYLDILSDGDVDTEGFSVTGPGVFNLVGDVSANFYIPEPGSLALAGLALSALGVGMRRRRRA